MSSGTNHKVNIVLQSFSYTQGRQPYTLSDYLRPQQEEPSYYTDNYYEYGGDWNESCKTYNHDDYLYHWNDRRPDLLDAY